MKRFRSIVFVILLALPMVAQEEPLCTDGTLLFREDFGGNDPSNPEVISDANDARAAVPGMSPNYTPCLSRTSGMSSGKFLVTKQGYQNGIQWHIMDDHTYPNDKTKGYLLQIDGQGDDAPFYTTMIEGLCPGIRLTFSAYVANVMTWGHYTNPNRHDIYPRMKFVLTDPSSGTELATYDTGDIPFDSAFIGDNSSWQYSAHWRLIGMNFTVPDDTYRVKLTIYNNVSSNGSGNDFVLDDFEIHLCAPPVTIEGEAEVCMNEIATLTANFENDGTFAEPLAYKWWHSTDSVTWSEISGFNGGILTFNAVQKNDSGWYKVAVSGDGNIENINCRAMSEPFRLRVNECAENLCIDGTLLFREDFGGNDPNDPDISMASVPGMDPSYHNSGNSLGSGNYTLRKEGWHNGIQWHWQDDHTYFGDKTRGYLLEVDGIGGAKPFYSKTIDGLCAGSKLTFSAYVVNVHYAGQLDYFGSSYVYPRMKFVLKDPTTGSILAEKSTSDIQPDWRYGTPETWKYARENKLSAEWQLIGMNFVVPDGIESIQMYIYNDVAHNGSGNDFALDDIEIHLCAPPVTIEGETEVCENTATTLTANFTNDGTFAEPLAYKWWHSTDSVTWSEISGFNGENLLIDAVQKNDSGWYKVAVSGDGNIESVNCRAMSEPFQLKVNECTEDLCIDGILLFREDFGGNDPNDPVISTAPVPGMSYTQIYVLEPGSSAMGSGRYLVAKEGYRNSTLNNYSLWHIMDDHTYPGDKTRGYLLEVDGKGGTQAFYETTMDGLCPGTRLTFSAYIANLETAGQYVAWKQQGRNSYLPQISFVITDPVTGAELARHNTDTIAHDWNPSAIDGSAYKKWQESAEWQLVGMHFTVPDGVSAVKLSILNNVRQDTGNDFALDDIEVHLCLPNPVISGESEVCQDSALSLTVEVTNDGTMAEPLEYKWWHSTDSLNWTEMSGFNGKNLLIDAVQKNDSGWYKVAVSGDGNIESVNCRAMSEPFRLKVNECTEDLCIDGILLFREDFGGNDPNDPIVGTDRVSGMDYSRYTQRLNADHVTGQAGLFWLIKSGYYHADTTRGRDPMKNHSNWYLQDDHTYPNDKTRGYLLEIDGLGGTAPFYSTVVHGVCPGTRLTFSAYVANVNKASNYIDGVHARIYPKLKFEIADAKTHTVLGSHSTGDIPYDPDLTVNTDFWYSSKWYLHGMTFTMPEAVDSIRLTIYNDVMNNGAGNDFALDDIEIRLCMTPDTIRTDTTVCDTLSRITWHGKEFAITDTLRDTLLSSCGFDRIYYELHVATKHCEPPCPELITITADTTVCDTLMPYRWRDTLFTEPATYEILYKDQRGCDSLLRFLTLNTQICCPNVVTITADTTVCDTLMPFTWTIGGQTFVFEQAETQERGMPHPKWTECTDTNYVLRLDTFHCEKLWQIIVNKYNWQLLLDNVSLSRFFPQNAARTYQWYKNEVLIPGANDDDYSEQNELCGRFQLRVGMDNGQTIWSNILEIGKAQVEEPVRVRIYDSHGVPVQENQVSHGLYLYRYEQGDRKWTEKRLIP